MKLSSIFLALLTTSFVTLANAQYISEGWMPPQDASPTDEASTAQPTPQNPTNNNENKRSIPSLSSLISMLEIENLLQTRPAVALFSQFGINITEKLAASIALPWDPRIPLITDQNYEDMIVKEYFETEEQERDRLWIMVVTITASRQEGLSKIVDSVFDEAYNDTMIARDLPNVRWGRIDYLNVTYLTTKWGLWQAPYLVLLQDRGQTLRFYGAHNLRLRPENLRQFLLTEGWKATPHWDTSFAPGGEREYIMEFFAKWLTQIYNVAVRLPRWVIYLVSASLGSLLIGWLHSTGQDRKEQRKLATETKKAQEPDKKQQPSTPSKSTATTTGRTDTPQSAKKSPAKRRR